MAVGMFLVDGLEASEEGIGSSGEGDDRVGEYPFSESVVVDDTGDVLPQPKNDPSLDAPGDFGNGLFVISELYDSFEYDLSTVLGIFMLCGGVGLVENMDIVAEGGTLVELESLHHGAVDSDAMVIVESLKNLACLSKEARA